jgi:NodT family efflux transporter outer membrane factor (OMF) lipoprotein
VSAPVPAQWQAPLPHGGQSGNLARWWAQWNDPLLGELIVAAQDVSPTLASARARVAQAQATRVAAEAGLAPRLDASLAVSRGNNLIPLPLSSRAQAGLQAAWELDIFGAQRDAVQAGQARLVAAQVGWHEARVSVAAEAASAYLGLRACTQQRVVAENDAASRAETARLTDLSAQAGFTAPATAALARASAAEASARLRQQRAQCDVEGKVLSALTGVDEASLILRLSAPWQPPPVDMLFAVNALPAQVLAQRPDVRQAELAVAAASAEVGAAQADRYPRLSLAGTVSANTVRTGGATTDLQTWSIGPLALTLPVLDAGRRAANTEAAKARYEEAVSLYRAQVRRAVSEVEQALVNLDSARERVADARAAADGFRVSFIATQARHRAGLASLVELEDARRTQLAAETALVGLQRELHNAWISLYRAAGGGWQGQTTMGTPP